MDGYLCSRYAEDRYRVAAGWESRGHSWSGGRRGRAKDILSCSWSGLPCASPGRPGRGPWSEPIVGCYTGHCGRCWPGPAARGTAVVTAVARAAARAAGTSEASESWPETANGMDLHSWQVQVFRPGRSAVSESAGHCYCCCYCSSLEAAGVLAAGRIAGAPAAAGMVGCRGMVVVLAAVACTGPTELAGHPDPMRSAAAGLGSIRVLGHRRRGAVEGGDTGCGSHLLAAVAGVAVAGVAVAGVAVSGLARPTLSTTLCGCAHLARTRAAGPTRSWSASGREGERRQRCSRKRHPAGIRRLHIVVVAAVAAAADVVASEAASGHAGSRPWRAIKAGVSVSGWAGLRWWSRALIPRPTTS
jgi:hypothetical protein